jgi:two-component system, sensor histidine kinase and response regulator
MADAPHATGAPGEQRLTAEYVAAGALLDAGTLEEAIPKILGAICGALAWEHGALWVVDRERDVLRCAYVWKARPEQFPSFDALSRKIVFQRGVGLPGRVWATGQPAWIADVVEDGNFPRAAAAAREGLHAALGFPVTLRGEVVSVIEFFSRETRKPDAGLLATLTTIGRQIGMFIDRRRAQEELDRFFALSLDLLCVAGFDGYFKRVNPAWQRTLGYTEAELLSRPYVEFVHPEDRVATVHESDRLSAGGEVLYFENRYLHKDGTLRWLLWASTPYPELQVVYATAHDITERKAAEETMAQYALDLQRTHRELADQASRLEQLVKELEVAKRRAEDATEAKSVFLANMSHEIRTPLNAILGMATLAQRTRLTIEQREYLDTIKTSGEALLAVINDILDFSKIEAHRLDLESLAFDVRETVGDAVKLLALRAAEKGLELACHVASDVPQIVRGDAGRLRQALLNIIGNAIKFTATGEVVLSVSVAAAGPESTTLHFAVRDTGIGIPASKQEQIFHAFTQADASTTRRYGGTGLGLAIAQRLVELMSGRIWVESDEGKGSTFHCTAVFEHALDAAALPPKTPTRLEGLRVLVVDDNATNRRILEEMLASWRMRPTVAADAGSALDVLRRASPTSRRFDAVIVDGQMPNVDGFMLAREIKSDRHLQATPVVMLTSAGRHDDIAHCRRIGIERYLTKPVSHSDLLDTLTSLFSPGESKVREAERHDVSVQAAIRPLRVLVAEDNAVNRKLVTTVLHKRGHRVTGVDNGRAAVDAVVAQRALPFDVVLMDLQMPEMSGFEATQAIRDHEGRGGARLPIIALTAHAMQGDRERCLDAGMDGYLSKPIDVDELVATVEHMALSTTDTTPRPQRTSPARPRRDVFDEARALRHTGNDRALLVEVISLFRADAPSYIERINEAIRSQDGEALRMAAHAIKGALATLGSERGRQLASELEQFGGSGRFDRAQAKERRLRDHLTLLDKAFAMAGLIVLPDSGTKRTVHSPDRKRARE